MHKPEFILENKIYKILWDFEIQKNHQILAWKKEKKKETKAENCRTAVPSEQSVKI